MLRLANHGAFLIDIIFGINHMKFYLFNLMVFNDFRNDVPIVWVITSRQKEDNLIQWLAALRAKAITDNPNGVLVVLLLMMQFTNRML